MRHVLFLLGLLLVGGCQAMDPLSGANDPHDPWWSLGFAQPAYMKVWVEDSGSPEGEGDVHAVLPYH